MQYRSLEIPDVLILEPARFSDERGFFSEIFSRDTMAEAGISLDIAQEH